MKNKYIIFAGMGLELIGIMLGCLFVGQKLDQAYDLKGLAMIGLSAAGLTGWLIQIVRLTKNIENSGGEEK